VYVQPVFGARAGPGYAVVWTVSHAEMTELVVVNCRIDSDGSGGCIMQHWGWCHVVESGCWGTN